MRAAQYIANNSYVHRKRYQICSILGLKTYRGAPFALHCQLLSCGYGARAARALSRGTVLYKTLSNY